MSKEKTLLKEVPFIDGVQEFLEEGYHIELLAKEDNNFALSGVPVDDSIRFSGDVSLFNKRVYTEEDLSISGSWFLDYNVLKISPTVKTSSYTYTYISYKRKSETKKEGLFSVDYDKGLLYTSTPIKNIKIDYKYSIQYVKGAKMEQVNPNEYTKETLTSIPTDDKSKLTFIYQRQEEAFKNYSKEFYKGGRINLLTIGEKDE